MTNREWCSKRWTRWVPSSFFAGLLVACTLLFPGQAQAGSPDWMLAAGRQSLPVYPEDTPAVVLLDEQVTTVKDSGEIDTVYRRVYKILRVEGRDFGTVSSYFDSETRLTYFKGWSVTSDGKEYEVKESDAIEFTPFEGALFQDTRRKVLVIPASEPGSLVAYEYQQRRRPWILQDSWDFQSTIPVRHARFSLLLPAGWDLKTYWLNHANSQPLQVGPNTWVWEFENISGVEQESSMPAWRAVAARLGVSYYPSHPDRQLRIQNSWADISLWYSELTADRRRASPEIREQTIKLTKEADTWFDKVRALTTFVQRSIRYVAISIGVGGYQPHAAADVFSNRYGDCKDKATLLSAMLDQIGVESHYVLIHTSRGVIAPEFPTLGFNHVILAIRLPTEFDSKGMPATVLDQRQGKLLLFDPTDSQTPVGFLPAEEQESLGLLVDENGGRLLKMPLAAATDNRLIREASLTLASTGVLSGDVTETRTGAVAREFRSLLLRKAGKDRIKILEDFLAGSLSGFELQRATIEGLDSPEANLILHYRFSAEKYAQAVGNLLLIRPRVLGSDSQDVLERKPRKYPLESMYSFLQTDTFEIALPVGYVVDEVPFAQSLDGPGCAYRSRVELKGNALVYRRDYEVKDIEWSGNRLDELKKFFRQIATDERSLAVLKHGAP